MTPQDELERIVELAGIRNVLTLLAVICSAKADRIVRYDAHRAKEWLGCASALDSAIVKIWGKL